MHPHTILTHQETSRVVCAPPPLLSQDAAPGQAIAPGVAASAGAAAASVAAAASA